MLLAGTTSQAQARRIACSMRAERNRVACSHELYVTAGKLDYPVMQHDKLKLPVMLTAEEVQ